MDFFEAQDRARRRSGRLVALFVLGVFGIITAGYFATIFGLRTYQLQRTTEERLVERSRDFSSGRISRTGWWQPDILALVALGTVVVVGGAAFFKWASYRAGGKVVAEMLGGRRVDPHTTDFRERQLLNVVEEMALASGVAMPAVFVLPEEPGINAFAAGLTTADAVVAVTRGSLEQLNRDELQGVIGHEFSHILNGDMRLNLRLAALVFGILVLSVIGRGLLRAMFYSRGGSRGKKDGSTAFLAGAGLVLVLLGTIGYFFGRLIQAAISRQREFLADASAVQFTRNSAGLAGALKKLAAPAGGSALAAPKATEVGHLFFASAFRSSFGGLWATHPPLAERIRAIDASVAATLGDSTAASSRPPAPARAGTASLSGSPASPTPAPLASGFAPPPSPASAGSPPASAETFIPSPSVPRGARAAFQPATALRSLGQITGRQLAVARQLLESLPPALRAAAEDSASATALVCGLLLGADPALRARQRQLVATHGGPALATVLAALEPDLARLPEAARLPLLQLALPALATATTQELPRFLGLLDELVHADATVSVFEFTLQRLLARHLRLAADPSAATPSSGSNLAAARDDVARLLSALAALTSTDTAAAYAAGTGALAEVFAAPTFVAGAATDLDSLATALDRLATLAPTLKRRVLLASATTIAADGTIDDVEWQLLRATSAALDCPIPVSAS